MFCIFDVKYGLDKSYFKVLSWWEVASFDSVRFIFEVAGVLERVISAVCILGNPIPTLRVAEETAGLRSWSHAAASTGAGGWSGVLTPAFPAAAEPGAGAVPVPVGVQEAMPRSLVSVQTHPSCLPQFLSTSLSPACIRSRCHNLLLLLLCSVAASHSSHDLKSCFQVPKPSRNQSSCFVQTWELNLSLFRLGAAAIPAAQSQGAHVWQGNEVGLDLKYDAS